MIQLRDPNAPQRPLSAVRFSGTSTHAHALERWILHGDYRYPDVQVRDLRPLSVVAQGEHLIVTPGQWLVSDGQSAWAIDEADLLKRYVPIEDHIN